MRAIGATRDGPPVWPCFPPPAALYPSPQLSHFGAGRQEEDAMALNWLKLPSLPLLRLLQWRPSRKTLKQGTIAAMLCAAIMGAFYVGRHGAKTQAGAAETVSTSALNLRAGAKSEPVVAYVYNNVPITRQELGEYLIERFGAERVDYLVNRKIIEMACAQRNIRVTEAEITAEFESQLRMLGCTEAEFVKQVLAPRNKTMFEYREDAIRPKIAMQRYFQDQVQVGEDELQKAFDIKYGPKVQCRWIVLGESQIPHQFDIWNRVKDDAAEFEREAKNCFIPAIAAKAGMAEPITKHYMEPNLEEAAFKLRPGEVSPLITMPDKKFPTVVILRCEKIIDADTTVTLGKVRNELYHDVFQATLKNFMEQGFQKLREQAQPQILLHRERLPQSQASAAPQMPGAGVLNRPIGPAGN
jgi:hypothetical protein